jgi:hypothetical protein
MSQELEDDGDVHALMSEMDWIKQEVDELTHDILDWQTRYENLRDEKLMWEGRCMGMCSSEPLGLKLSEALREVDRLKAKCNELIERKSINGIQ